MSTRPALASDVEVARSVLDSLHEGCQVISRDYRYLYLNDVAIRHAQCPASELLGKTMMECYPGIDQTPMFDILQRSMTERADDRMENDFTYPDGTKGSFELRFLPVPEGVCILSLDVTARKRTAAELARTEEQLRQAQKMEAVGRLAGGLAHDFNNLLSVILSYSDLLLADLNEGDPIRIDLEEIRRAGERAGELTRQLLTFASAQISNFRMLDLNNVLTHTGRMLARLLGEGIELTLLHGPKLGTVKVDAGQIEQVLMNLAVNSKDAMPNGGKLTIETSNVDLDEDYAKLHLGVTPGPHVMVAVTDTGVGMEKETQERIFEPFFTTKAKGKGTGLGLSTVFGIVKQSGGHLWVYSEPGQGTTFRLYFPRADGVPTDLAEEEQRAASSGPARGGTETVLLVEDDDQVRAVARGILRRNGYTVLEARGAGEALLVSEQHTAKIHLLLTDVVMPRLTGPKLADRLLADRPEMKVLFMSGFPEETGALHGILESGAPLLQKPLTPATLARRVRQTLGSS